MRRPCKRWLLTFKIALVGALLTPLITTGLELWAPADQAASASASTGPGAVLFHSDYRVIAWCVFVGMYLGLMVGLIVNAVAMIIEEPRPHW